MILNSTLKTLLSPGSPNSTRNLIQNTLNLSILGGRVTLSFLPWTTRSNWRSDWAPNPWFCILARDETLLRFLIMGKRPYSGSWKHLKRPYNLKMFLVLRIVQVFWRLQIPRLPLIPFDVACRQSSSHLLPPPFYLIFLIPCKMYLPAINIHY